jgi:hypothetical protein
MLFRDDVVNGEVQTMPVPSMKVEMRTVRSTYNPANWPMKAIDLPNLELEYRDKSGDTLCVHFNIRLVGEGPHNRSYGFEEKVVEFATRVGEAYNLTLLKRPHNSNVKGLRGRIKDLADSLWSPHLGSRHMVDSVLAPRILRCGKETTTFRAFRYCQGMAERMKQQHIYGITGFFKVGHEVGYFIIDGMTVPLRTLMPDSGHDYIISDASELVLQYFDHITKHWPFLRRDGMAIHMNTKLATDHHELNTQAGEFFYALKDKAGDLKPRKIMGTLPSRDDHTRDPDERWHNVTAQDIAKQFCSSPAQYQKFLNKVTELKIPFTAVFQVDIYDSSSYIYLKSEDTTPLVVIERTEVAA